jgi:hypothetical protein
MISFINLDVAALALDESKLTPEQLKEALEMIINMFWGIIINASFFLMNKQINNLDHNNYWHNHECN